MNPNLMMQKTDEWITANGYFAYMVKNTIKMQNSSIK
jgi:hypothetical protein